jgi:methionyl aminopeptidase
MIIYKTKEEIEIMRQTCLLVSQAHATAAALLKPGMTTLEVNSIVHHFIYDHGGIPSFSTTTAFRQQPAFPMNAEVVHGFPGEHVLKAVISFHSI